MIKLKVKPPPPLIQIGRKMIIQLDKNDVLLEKKKNILYI